MNKKNSSLETITQGALGAMSFGIYHHCSNKISELNNENQLLQQKIMFDKIENDYKNEIQELKNKIIKLELELNKKKKWFKL